MALKQLWATPHFYKCTYRKNIRTCSQYLTHKSMFVSFKVTSAGDIFKGISFLLHWKSNLKKNNLLRNANTKSEWRQHRLKRSLKSRNWEKLKIYWAAAWLLKQTELLWRRQMGSNAVFNLCLWNPSIYINLRNMLLLKYEGASLSMLDILYWSLHPADWCYLYCKLE